MKHRRRDVVRSDGSWLNGLFSYSTCVACEFIDKSIPSLYQTVLKYLPLEKYERHVDPDQVYITLFVMCHSK